MSVAGLAVLAKALVDLRLALSSLSWPLASGEITSSAVAMRWGKSLIPSWEVHLFYTYGIGREVLTGERIFFGDLFCSSTRAVDIANRYPARTAVQVHYDPKRADRSVLEPGLTRYPFYGLATGMAVIGLGVALLVG